MRWIVRIGMVLLCILIWMGILFAVPDIATDADETLVRKSFPFPAMLPDSPIYVWAMMGDGEMGTAVLHVQSIGSNFIENLQISFLADNDILTFELENLLPGGKVYIQEKNGILYEDWYSVSYISHTVTEKICTSSLCEEDYSCKK